MMEGDEKMRVINKVLFLPIYLVALVMNLAAEIVKQAFSFVCGFFFLMMATCLLVTILNHAWAQTILLAVLMLLGYGILFAVVALKVMIEEFKNFCFAQVF